MCQQLPESFCIVIFSTGSSLLQASHNVASKFCRVQLNLPLLAHACNEKLSAQGDHDCHACMHA